MNNYSNVHKKHCIKCVKKGVGIACVDSESMRALDVGSELYHRSVRDFSPESGALGSLAKPGGIYLYAAKIKSNVHLASFAVDGRFDLGATEYAVKQKL